MSTALDIQAERCGKALLVIHLHGRLDSTTAPSLELKLNENFDGDEGLKRALFVCENLHYISSAGLSVFLGLVRRLGGAGEVALCAISSSIHKVIKMAGFTQFIHVYSTAEQAIKTLSEAE